MKAIKTFLVSVALLIYFKAAFAMGFGLAWSVGALAVLAVISWMLKMARKGIAKVANSVADAIERQD